MLQVSYIWPRKALRHIKRNSSLSELHGPAPKVPCRHNHIHEHMSSSLTLFHKPTPPVPRSVLISSLPYREKKGLRYVEQIFILLTVLILQCSTCSLILHHCTSNSLVQSWLEWSSAVSFQLLPWWRETAVLFRTWKCECKKYALQLFGWQNAPPYDPACREWPEMTEMGHSLSLCREHLHCTYLWPQR